jgi:hypothetical protein
MALVVTGLSQDGDVHALHQALADAGLPTDPLQVIGPDESTQGVSRGLATSGGDILTSDLGMRVPGINSPPGHSAFFRNETLPDRLGDLEIPDGEVDNYVEALERGRSVVAYFAHLDNVDKVEQIFRSVNLTNVRRF